MEKKDTGIKLAIMLNSDSIYSVNQDESVSANTGFAS